MTNDPSDLPAGDDPLAWINWTTAQQALASDPDRSAWVSANAGSGKTHVLTQRVVRLLLAGARPASILCLTYTKAAASEMSNRVFDRLAEWATLSEEELAARIADVEGETPDRLKLSEARQLFARALETPGGLRIQTIHAFCEALLHQFPLEANVAGHFSVLDDRAAATVLADARRALLTATSNEDDPDLADAFSRVLSISDETGLEALLGDVIANRHAIRRFLSASQRVGGPDLALRLGLGLEPETTEEKLTSCFWPLPALSGAILSDYVLLAREKGGERALEIAEALAAASQEVDWHLRIKHLEKAFYTATGSPRADSTLCTAAMTKAMPDLRERLVSSRDHVAACRDRLAVFRMYEATKAALTLAKRLDRDYEDLKKARSQLDFEDLIERTASLLTRGDVGPWVHYKLDQGIDHILVDEAQDTSPIQWAVIRSLREDFFSGIGARPRTRTFFAVGDEKQSIYSFQGARPERFSEEATAAARLVSSGGERFSAVRLPLSFRSTSAVLSAVDQVFAIGDNARGLSALNETVVHMSSRMGHPGAVDVWDTIAPEVSDTSEDWTAPFDATPESAPSAILARRIAHQIEQMVGRETVIEKGVERPIRPGDILVLVRKRDSFVNALTRALKRRNNIPVAGADRLRLTVHIAVQDLLALGRFVLLPSDDLSLAALLKSPLFDLNEEDLFELAAVRPAESSVWTALQRYAQEEGGKWRSAADRLMVCISLSRNLSVHDFYAHVLGPEGGRRAFLARLGTEVTDILDEFLNFALTFETSGLPGLQSFVSALEMEAPEVKREHDKDRDEVRIMTVHASKGLEAPVVFLVDGGSKAFNHTHLPKLRLVEAGLETPLPAWTPIKALGNPLVSADTERLRRLAEEEYRRLLYVAMTRAADRLIVCGYRGKQEPKDTWHQMISEALRLSADNCTEARFEGPEGEWNGLKWRLPTAVRAFECHQQSDAGSRDDLLPEALFQPLPPGPQLPRPLSPSGAGAFVDDVGEDLTVSSPLFGEKVDSGIALQKGKLTHRMLQVLPSLPLDQRDAAARRYADRAARFWPTDERERLVRTVLAILEHPDLAPVFSLHAQAEVSIMGTIVVDGQARAVSGRIDRMAVTDDRVILLDFKTNRSPPRTIDAVPFSHRAQLAIYRELLKPLYPNKQIECLLAYTEGGLVMAVPAAELTQTLADLKTS
ncbi:DNA helicase/exodeoxyribonuclease V subunit A [Ciceribacter lividus]|uniref:DNA 3'-5' helicase n=1 Tax=Ciceribacter lividus TaxID=1197950 RepID=A0A6I7HGZ0_9HYPH|nr:double-strand break repair helicase AddA [Ciceribacter lividus]RCW20396.1 DNA helicase/exodeoxyribonuclease V subunit A [Ciceribacter lividus]